jgi:large subunit ribosomal protein L25
VIAKAVDFHPVTDRPMHFDLYRVDAHQLITIAVAVHFKNADGAPFDRAGGALEVVRHDVELLVPADQIPEELVVDLSNAEVGDTIRMSAITLPQGAQAAIKDRDFVIATIKLSSAAVADDAADAAVAAEQAAESAAESEAAED